MKSGLTAVTLCLISLFTEAQTSIYSFQLDSITGSKRINFSAFQGKKILVVCVASQDTSFSQYAELQQLYQLYKDSLAIVVVPTNSFGTEQGGNNQIAAAYTQTGQHKFPVVKKAKVKNPEIHPLYAWLTLQAQNGMMNTQVNRPFFKFLINKNGQFRGVYGQRVRPMSTVMRQAIENIR